MCEKERIEKRQSQGLTCIRKGVKQIYAELSGLNFLDNPICKVKVYMEVMALIMTATLAQTGIDFNQIPFLILSIIEAGIDTLSKSRSSDPFEKIAERLEKNVLNRFDVKNCDLDKTEKDVLPEYLEIVKDAVNLIKDQEEFHEFTSRQRNIKTALLNNLANRVTKEQVLEFELAFIIYKRVMDFFNKMVEDIGWERVLDVMNEMPREIPESDDASVLLIGLRFLVLVWFIAKNISSGPVIGRLISRFLDTCIEVVSLFYRNGERLDLFDGIEPEKRVLFTGIIASRVFAGLSDQDVHDIASERITLSEI